ncbi:hypothetical protein DICPUDRAFT_156569, partial [Dictyostelium purpureum]
SYLIEHEKMLINNLDKKPNSTGSNPMSYDDYEFEDDPIELELRKKMLTMLNQNSIPNSSSSNNNNNSNNNISNLNNFNLEESEEDNIDSDGNNSSNHSDHNLNNEYYNNFSNDHMFSTPTLSRKSKNKQHNRSISVNQPQSSSYQHQSSYLQPQSQLSNSLNQKSFLTSSNPGFLPTLGSPKFESLGNSTKGTNLTTTIGNNNNNNNNNNMMFNNNGSNISNSSSQGEEYFNLNEKYLLTERDRIKSMAKEFKFEIEIERKVIKEYKLYAVEEWIFKSNHIWSAVSYTGNYDDKIVVSVIKPTQQNKQLYNLISKPPNSTFYPINTPSGQILLANCGDSSQYGLNLIEIPDGDFDEHIEDIKTNLCLKRLGCTNPKYKVSYMKLADSCVDKFRKLSGFPKATKSYVNEFVMEIQAALSHLNYLPLLTKIDGMYDQKTINALKAFQVDSNKHREGSGLLLLPTEGYLDQITFDELQEEILKLASKLESLGYTLPDNPTKNFKEFNVIIKSFQETYRIYPNAPGKNILLFIEKMNLKVSQTILPPPSSNNIQSTFSTSPSSNSTNINKKNKQNNNKSNNSNNSNSNSNSNSNNNLPGNSNYNNYLNYDDEIESFKRGQEKTDAEIFRYDDDDDEDEDDDYYEDSDSQDIIDPYVDDDDDEYFSNEDEDFKATNNNNKSDNTNIKSKTDIPISNNVNNTSSVATTTNNEKQFQEIQKQTLLPNNTNVLSQTQNEINNLEPINEAEEKEKLKQTILRLEVLVDKQHSQYCKLKEDFDHLSDSYYELKEKSLKSIAVISTNEKMFTDINNRWNKLTKKEIPEIEDKINSNVDIIQSYSSKMKRLDDIVTSIQKKNDRNIFLSFLISFGSFFLIICGYIAIGLAKIKKSIVQPINNNANNTNGNNNSNGNNNNNNNEITSNSNKNRQTDEAIQDFLKQKLNITTFFENN